MIWLLRRIYSYVVKIRNTAKIFFLSLAGDIKVEAGCVIQKSAVIKSWKGGKVAIGMNTEIMHGVIILTYGGTITIGANCSINPYCILYGHGGLTIGNNVLIAGGTMVIPSNHCFTSKEVPIAHQGNTCKGIIIEDDVWIGHACSILDGTTIGRGSIVAAGSVVNSDVPAFTIVGGVPAKVLKRRG